MHFVSLLLLLLLSSWRKGSGAVVADQNKVMTENDSTTQYKTYGIESQKADGRVTAERML